MPAEQAHAIEHIIFLVFSGAALLSTAALFTRQSLLVAYILLGGLLGPWGLQLVTNSSTIQQAGEIGIIFLLFLVGLHLQPQNLFHSLRKMSWITFSSSFIFFITGFGLCYTFGYSYHDSLIIGLASMFSSTIIGLKLLPTTILHHQHTGELVISILLLQDIIAIAAMLILQIIGNQNASENISWILIAFPVLLLIAYLFQRYILAALLSRFDTIHEYIFILSIGWCLLMAELSHFFGLTEEIGAFIAGVALASNPISFYIAENLKQLRDFFLVLFFFSIGASFNFDTFGQIFAPACLLAGLILMLKPMVFNWLLRQSGEVNNISWEIGVRLGQMSEFSLLLITIALQTQFMSSYTGSIAQAAIIITFIVSCYWTVIWYPTPLAATDKLRRD
jgi:Kef-type K+ transport system membrane component KefB